MEKVSRKFCRQTLLAALCASLMAVTTGVHAQSAAEKTLLAKAQSLANAGQLDMAVQTWQQVLLADGKNQEALLGIARADMQLGKTEEAQQYLNRLRAAGGNAAEIAKIQGMPSVQPQADRIRQAGELAQQRRYDEAMQIYRSVFGDNPPAGNYALAYYDTEAAIPADRPHAIAGLRRLSKQFPADSRYAVTLGRVLTYDPATRTEGMSILRQYENVPAAQAALSQAETWNTRAANPEPGAAAAPSPAPVAVNSPESLAYRALNSGRIDDAKQRFQGMLDRQPNSPGALAGMGYVAMKQQDFGAAASYFERARSAGARNVDSALNTANFWLKMSSAGDALKSGDTDAAIEGYRSALAIKPNSADALEGLGGALAQSGNSIDAADAFDRAIHADPQRASAWRGLFVAQSTGGSAQAALDINDRIPRAVRARLESDPEYLRLLAQDYLAVGRKADVDRVVAQALALPFPNNGRDLPLQTQLQYAALLMTAKKYEPAIRLYQQVVSEDPENAGAWRALIAAQHQLNDDEAALATVAKMPQAMYDKEQSDASFLVLIGSIYQSQHDLPRAQKYLESAASLDPSLQPGISLQLGDVYAAQGNSQKAYGLFAVELNRNPENQQAWLGELNALHQMNRDHEALRRIASMPDSVRVRVEQDPAYLQTLASIQVSVNQPQAALKTFAQLSQIYAAQGVDEPVGVQIQYGWALLKMGDDRRLYAVVSNLSSGADLTDEQQADLNHLLAAWSVQRANTALAAGDQRRALAILGAAAQAFPKDAGVYGALAGAYMKSGQYKQALAVYAAMDMSDASATQYQGAIGAAMAARDMTQAEQWLQAALDRYKGDPGILKLAAQYEQARGNNERAAAYYRAALDAMGPAPVGGAVIQNGSPSYGPSPTQQLMQLLAPENRKARMNELDSAEGGKGVDISWESAPPSDAPTLGDYADTPGNLAGSPVEARPQVTATLEDYAPPQAQDEDLPPVNIPHQTRTTPRRTVARMQDADAEPAPVSEPRSLVASSDDPLRPASVDVPAPIATEPQQSLALPTEEETAPAGLLQSAVHDLNAQPALAQTLPQDTSTGQDAPVTPPAAQTPVVPLPDTATQDTTNTQPATGFQPAALPPLSGPSLRAERPKTEREQVEEQLALLEGASSNWIGGSADVGYRSGQPGYDRLAMFSIPIEASASMGPNVRTTVIARPVLLDAGQAESTATVRQGTLPAGSVPYVQSAAGIGGEFQLRAPAFAASIGYTPHGFLVENVIGSLYVHPPASHFTLTFDRDPIVDTQLSYAGLRDLGSRSVTYVGNVWGGVIANAGEAQLAFGDNRSGWYIQGGGQYITGEHVQTNTRFDGDAGAYWAAWHRPEYGSLSLGVNFFGMHYDHNLRYFTYGQGGYFSPGAYMLASVPFTFNGHYGPRFHYRVSGDFGAQAFQEDSAPYFPLDPAIQAANNNPYYPEQTSVGGNYSFDGEGAYAIAEHWYVGGYLSFNNTRDYANEKLGFFVRYLFRPQPALEENGPTGIFPVEGLRPLQVP